MTSAASVQRARASGSLGSVRAQRDTRTLVPVAVDEPVESSFESCLGDVDFVGGGKAAGRMLLAVSDRVSSFERGELVAFMAH